MAGGESGGASIAKLFVVNVGDGTVGRRIASCVGVVRKPQAAVTVMKSVGSAPSWDKEDGDKREGLPLLWVILCLSGGGGFVAPPPSGGGGILIRVKLYGGAGDPHPIGWGLFTTAVQRPLGRAAAAGLASSSSEEEFLLLVDMVNFGRS
jgi:hypothetical protein